MMNIGNKIVTLLAIGFAISFLSCGMFAYLWIDRSISATYLNASVDSTVSAFKNLSSLIETDWIGISELDLLEKLRAEIARRNDQNISIDTKSEKDTILFDGIRFKFELGRLKKISL